MTVNINEINGGEDRISIFKDFGLLLVSLLGVNGKSLRFTHNEQFNIWI